MAEEKTKYGTKNIETFPSWNILTIQTTQLQIKKMSMGSYLKSEMLIAKGRDDEIKYRGFGNQEQKS